jgi:hypothetical protein
MKTFSETVIVGAGVSGIACAKTLLEEKKDFIIISPNIGGRVQESANSKVQYGAYYITKNYDGIKNVVKIKKKINPFNVRFNTNKNSYSILNIRIFSNPIQLLRLILLIKIFKKHYQRFKQECSHTPQPESLRKNPYLFNLYKTSASEFIKEKKIERIVNDYLAGMIYGSTFTNIDNINAFTLLHLSLPIILPVYEFTFEKEKILDLLKSNYIQDKILRIQKNKDTYLLLTEKKNIFECNNLVLATPPEETKRLLDVDMPLRSPISSHMYHIEGSRKKRQLKGKINFFNYKSDIIVVAQQEDETFLLYSKKKDPEIQRYFDSYKIINHIHWNPAFNIGGSNIIEFKYDDRILVIGDNNVCCLEDCYIYGSFTAKYIKDH